MNLFNFIFQNLINFCFVILSLYLILFTYNGILKLKPFTSYLFVISTIGCLISFFISFNLNLGRYTIYVFYFITSILFLNKIVRGKKIRFKNHIEDFSFFCFIFLIVTIYLIYNLEFEFHYDGHDSYIYGIPFEILEGNYYSRIKIWDNYPLVWSKYHFLTGSVSSIIISFALTKNIFLYKMYELIIAYVVMKSIQENLNSQSIKDYVKILLISLFFLVWFFNSNGALSLAFFFLSLIFYNQKRYSIAFIFTLFFMVALSRNVIPGMIILILLLYYYAKKIKFTQIYLYLIFPLLNLFAMIFYGRSPIKIDINEIFNLSSLNNFTYLPGERWTHLFYQHTLTELLNSIKNYLIFDADFFIRAFSFGFLSFIIMKVNIKNKLYLLTPILLSFLIFLSISYQNESFDSTSNYSIYTLFFIILEFLILFFFLPIIVIKNSTLNKKLKSFYYYYMFLQSLT